VRRAAESDPRYPGILFLFLGTAAEGETFFARHWPTARAVADPAQRLYRGFGLTHGSMVRLFGPSVWTAALRAAVKGNGVGRPSGDVLTMPGFVLVEDTRILWRHPLRHIGDHPNFSHISQIA